MQAALPAAVAGVPGGPRPQGRAAACRRLTGGCQPSGDCRGGENVTDRDGSGGVAGQGGGEVGHALARSQLGTASWFVTTRAAGDALDRRSARDRWGRSGRLNGSTRRHNQGRYAFGG